MTCHSEHKTPKQIRDHERYMKNRDRQLKKAKEYQSKNWEYIKKWRKKHGAEKVRIRP